MGAPRYVDPIAHAASSTTAMPTGSQELVDRAEVGRCPALVDDDDGPSPIGHHGLDRRSGQTLRHRVDVGEHRRGTDVPGRRWPWR